MGDGGRRLRAATGTQAQPRARMFTGPLWGFGRGGCRPRPFRLATTQKTDATGLVQQELNDATDADYARQICRTEGAEPLDHLQAGRKRRHSGAWRSRSTHRGGQARDHNLNQARRAQAAQVKAAEKARPERQKRPAGQKPAANSSHDAIVATLREITAPAEIMMFARVALDVGCTPLQVYVLANRLMIQPCMVPEQITARGSTRFRGTDRCTMACAPRAGFRFPHGGH